jgi:hypothetical protein
VDAVRILLKFKQEDAAPISFLHGSSLMPDDNSDFAARVNLGILVSGACHTETPSPIRRERRISKVKKSSSMRMYQASREAATKCLLQGEGGLMSVPFLRIQRLFSGYFVRHYFFFTNRQIIYMEHHS